jgi:RNA polymerase sigma-70 factor, ECF subfamily
VSERSPRSIDTKSQVIFSQLVTPLVRKKLADSGRKPGAFCHYNDEFGPVLNREERMLPPDEQCVRCCLNNHPEAFRVLVERHQAALMRRLCARLGNAEEATEAAQETFVRAYFALRDLRKPEAFFPWLVGIADRVAKESYRARQRQRTVAWEKAEPAAIAGKHEPQGDPEVAEAVAKLPDTYREVIVLRFYEGQSCDEISRDLRVPLGTVTKRLSRAYSLLRERLGGKVGDRQSEVIR